MSGVSFEDIILGVSVLRNQHLANVFYRLKLIEAYGTGMLKINESYADFDVKPKIEVTDNAFKITLPNVNYGKSNHSKHEASQNRPAFTTSAGTRENAVIGLFEERDTVARKDVEEALGMSQATAVLILREMVNKGLLQKEGGGKYLRYRLSTTE